MSVFGLVSFMEILRVVSTVLIVLLSGLVLFYLALYLSEKGMRQKVRVHSIFKGFRQKIWMTTGLGVVFSSLYFLAILMGSYFDDQTSRLEFFFLVYNRPVVFIYLGLLAFAFISITIYLVRLVIKHLYNTRSKY